jgi:GNAT superfamily N-acetyltransferase
MIFREAQVSDIKQIQRVRHSVKENVLSNPALVTDTDCEEYLTVRGKGWVCEIENAIVGFAIADLKAHNIWALFIHPDHAGKGIGKKLHHIMMNWYFTQTSEGVWLSTAPHTKAEVFYKMAGWKQTGTQPNGELRFEMSFEDWKQMHDR